MTDGVATTRSPALDRLRSWPRRHPMVVDGTLSLIVMVVAGLRRLPLDQLLGFLIAVPLIWRRRYPMVVFACVSAVAATQWAFDRQLLADVVLLVVLYTVAAYRDLRLALIALGVVEVGVLLAVVRWTKSGGAGAFVDAFVLLSSLATAAYVLGRNVRNRRAYLASVEDRARRAEFERDQQAQLAAAAERARIAREMHDIVTHNLSVMIALADGAAFAVHQNPTAAEGAVRQVSATGRQALGEMHRLLGVLRGNETEAMRAPQPGIEQLDALAEQVRSAGLPTSLTMTGTPFPVSPTAGLAVYRVVQEALTNVLKHARSPTQAKVTVQFQEPVIQVEIDDDGVGGVRSVAPGGHGLDGMAERVTMFDGSVHAGPRPDGGWRVSAILASGGVAS